MSSEDGAPIKDPSVLDSALDYIKRGWMVFPLHGIVVSEEDGKARCTCRTEDCEDAGKHPITRRGVKDASKDEETIRIWFSDSRLNLAIACGEASGITILDIDIGKKGGDITWAGLISGKGEPDTLMSRTGSGGLHVFFKYNSVLRTSSNTLGPGVDCRNDDGYIVAPPSMHRCGERYRWLDSDLGASKEIASIPSWLTKKPEKIKDKKKRKNHYTINDAKGMLEHIPADDREMWRNVGIILGREYTRSDEAWEVYVEWSDKWTGKKSRNHDVIMREAFYELSIVDGGLSFGTILKAALDNGWAPKTGSIPLENFLFYAPENNFIYKPSRQFWTASSVDAAVSMINAHGDLVKASDFLKANHLITSMTSDPDLEEVKKEFDCLGGILVASKGGSLFNQYRSPICESGDPEKAARWIDHVKKVFPRDGDADQFLNYMAHRAQKPGEKPRFALVLVGPQGVGKDTAISMCGPALGEWNIQNIDPEAVLGSFNEYMAKVLVVVSESANSQEMSKWTFNEKMKVFIAGTPDYVTVNPKYGHKFSARMHCGVILTTNHLGGLFIPQDDRRYDVIQSLSREEMFGVPWIDPDAEVKTNGHSGASESDFDQRPTIERMHEYFIDFWRWFREERGAENIAGYLRGRDISQWNASSGQRITEAHREIVSHGYDADQWLIDCLTKLGNPAVIHSGILWETVEVVVSGEMTRKEMTSRLVHAMPRIGWSRLIGKGREADGRWVVGETSVTVYYDSKKTSAIDAERAVRSGKLAKGAF